MRVSDLISQLIIELGQRHVFSLPGYFIIDLSMAMKSRGLDLISFRHEAAAVMAADGYSRSRGTVATTLINTGPSFMNAIGPLMAAKKDQIPIVTFVGVDEASRYLDEGLFQTAPIPEALFKATVHLRKYSDIVGAIRQAYRLAASPPGGPVLIVVPIDVARRSTTPDAVPHGVLEGAPPTQVDYTPDIDHIERKLSKSQRPLFVFGGGSLGPRSRDLANALTLTLKIPSLMTIHALGLLEDDNPYNMGWIGTLNRSRGGSDIYGADCIVAFGARLSDRFIESKFRNSDITQVNISPDHFAYNRQVSRIVGDCIPIMEKLLERSETAPPAEGWRPAPHRGSPEPEDTGNLLYRCIDTLYAAHRDAIVSCDDGTYTVPAIQLYNPMAPGRFLFSGNLAYGGYSLPAAVGAKLANPETTVVCITGDGGLLAVLGELSTVRALNIGLLMIVFNNSSFLTINQWSGGGLKADLPDARFSQIATNFGIAAACVGNLDAFREALDQWSGDAPLLIEVIIPPIAVTNHFTVE
ncbi:MAG: thiamine pyrophosphate-binding protein [Alphaproteobacteria bacterium]|nr:thiamine pyrophosphate-binding protein [Alphaproteobacteria bacterium]